MLNIQNAANILSLKDFKWNEIETKPELFQYNHYMKFYYFADSENFWGVEDNHNVPQSIVDIIKSISSHNEKVGKVYFLGLDAQQYPVRQYEEPYEYTSLIKRNYIPIVVNSGCTFCIESDMVKPKVGDNIVVDPDSLYSIYNEGDSFAVYLVVDIFKN